MKHRQWICGFIPLLLIGATSHPVFSASPIESGTQYPGAQDSNQSEILNAPENQIFEIPLVDLGLPANAALNSPFQEVEVAFSLPPYWDLTLPAVLELNVTSEFYTFLEAFTEGSTGTESAGVGGNLEITLNSKRVDILSVSQNGNFAFNIELPLSAFSGTGLVQTLKIGWNSVLACQYSIASILTIQPTSLARFTYKLIPYKPTISGYPAPFFIDRVIMPETTAIIIPQVPSEQELSALLSIAAGLGKLTNGNLSYKLFMTDQMFPEIMGADNMILVGKFDSLNSTLLELGVENEIRKILDIVGEGNGLVFLDVSPWNPGRALAVVTGKDNGAVLKAATALGANGITPYSENHYTIINDINFGLSDSQFQIDQTLIELGGQDVILIRKLGKTLFYLPFVIPPEISINPEAYLELNFRHSQLLDYLRSSITVSINGILIGNIQLSDQTNENGRARFILPPNVIKPSANVLSITANLVSQDICGDSRTGEYWASIFGDSYLHLPPTIETRSAGQNYFLSDFPLPFVSDLHLKNTIFVLDQDDFFSWKKAFDLAYEFGNMTRSDLLIPSAKYARAFSQDMVAGNYLVVGLTGHIPFSSGINQILPLSFNSSGNWENNKLPGVNFESNHNQDLGYLEISHIKEKNLNIISIMGNTITGLENAVKVLKTGSNADLFKSMNIAVIAEDGRIYGAFYQAAPPQSLGNETNGDLKKTILSPSGFPIFLLFLVVISIAILMLWPIVFRRKSK